MGAGTAPLRPDSPGTALIHEFESMAWVYLILAGLFEIAWAVGLKQTHGWTRLWPGVMTVMLMIVSFSFLSLALRSLPLGTAYAIWTGIGAVGTVCVGMVFFNEPRTVLRLVCIVMIVSGIVGLKLTTSTPGAG